MTVPVPITRDFVRVMAAYHAWMNEKTYDLCAQLSDERRREDRRAFFGSVHGTLAHLLYGDLAWFGRFKDGKPRITRPDDYVAVPFAELRRVRRALDGEIGEWTATIDAAWLAAPFRYRSMTTGQENEKPAWLLVMHMFNHQTHHRGQLTTLLTQFGLDIGVTDLSAMPLTEI
jgi:uncharacterized damage-inducible protein DinB